MDNKIINPEHYIGEDGREAIDIVREALTRDEFIGYLKGSAMKYKLRAGKKRHIPTDMALEFLRILPKENTAILVDDVKRHFTIWHADQNNKMAAHDQHKETWFVDRLGKEF